MPLFLSYNEYQTRTTGYKLIICKFSIAKCYNMCYQGKRYLFPTNIFSRKYSNIGKDVQLLVLNFKGMLIINMTYQIH